MVVKFNSQFSCTYFQSRLEGDTTHSEAPTVRQRRGRASAIWLDEFETYKWVTLARIDSASHAQSSQRCQCGRHKTLTARLVGAATLPLKDGNPETTLGQ